MKREWRRLILPMQKHLYTIFIPVIGLLNWQLEVIRNHPVSTAVVAFS
jgi:hypothetical protein